MAVVLSFFPYFMRGYEFNIFYTKLLEKLDKKYKGFYVVISMLYKMLFIACLLLLVFFSNCSASNYWNLYNSTNNTNPAPEYSNPNFLLLRGGYFFHLNKIPGGIGNNAEAKLSGRSCSHSILYLVSIGDSSIESTTGEAKIKKIASVSYEQFAILAFVYHRFCTTVTGE
jgi:hypothetical protein